MSIIVVGILYAQKNVIILTRRLEKCLELSPGKLQSCKPTVLALIGLLSLGLLYDVLSDIISLKLLPTLNA